jgi:hypothetical protein
MKTLLKRVWAFIDPDRIEMYSMPGDGAHFKTKKDAFRFFLFTLCLIFPMGLLLLFCYFLIKRFS